MSVPYYGRLSLVCDAYGSYVGSRDIYLVHGLDGDSELRSPYLICIVLHIAGSGKILGKFSLGHTAYVTLLIEEYAALAGGPCIKCHYISCHIIPP